MVNFILVQLIVFVFSVSLFAQVDRVHLESYLGEKNLDSYTERYQPIVFHDVYQGKLSFQDDLFFKNFFNPYLFQKESDYSSYLRSELNVGISCSNELLARHYDDIRYAYRLITLSYLIENEWHLKLMSDQLRLKNGCSFDLNSWVKSCKPKTVEMKKFVDRLSLYLPKYEETIPVNYTKSSWVKELNRKEFKWQSQYRLNATCNGGCSEENMPQYFKMACESDQKLMTQICSEEDEIHGLSGNRDAYYLLGLSNIINTFNKEGEAMGCLRRYAEIMSHKEVRYEVLDNLFPFLQAFLRQRYQERFLQGRVFFFGSGKEFEQKGLSELYVKDQPLQVEKLPVEDPGPAVVSVKKEEAKKETVAPVKTVTQEAKKEVYREIKKPTKSAFLLASEIRLSSGLDKVEVDMLKLKYDYVFSLNMINTLSERLKTFMTRDALVEMMNYDKLGSKDGPVPLLFLKYMIDMQEHQGLWNMISVLGNRFYVSNEIDTTYSPKPELVHLINNDSTGNQWQLFILKP